jgi:hypothetical protein
MTRRAAEFRGSLSNSRVRWPLKRLEAARVRSGKARAVMAMLTTINAIATRATSAKPKRARMELTTRPPRTPSPVAAVRFENRRPQDRG